MDKFKTIIDALAETIETKNNTIMLQKWEIERLQKQLAEAEKHVAEIGAMNDGVLCKKNIEFRKDGNE